MKIYYLIATGLRNKPTTNKDVVVEYTRANSLKEALAIFPGSVSEEEHSFLKLLMKNNDFLLEIAFIRNYLKIPKEGYSIYDEVPERDKMRLLISSVYAPSIVERYSIPYNIRNKLEGIIMGGYVVLPISQINIISQNSPFIAGTIDTIQIHIDGKVSQRDLIRFIASNWSTFEKRMQVFNDVKTISVSKKARKIMELRDKNKLSFRKIVKILDPKDQDNTCNEDSVKKAYHTAKKTIRSIKKKK